MTIARIEGNRDLPRTKPWTEPGALIVRALTCSVAATPVEGAQLRFGRNLLPEVEVTVGEDDPRVSRKHGLLVHRRGWWYLSNTGRSPIEVSGNGRIHSDDEPMPLNPGVTTLLITGSQDRKHLLELHVNSGDGQPPAPAFGQHTTPTRTWQLSDRERLVLTILGQHYLLRDDPHPQPLARQRVADWLNELDPGAEWNAKRVDRIVENVRLRLSKNGVPALIREEVPEPIGNALNHNLLTELVIRTNSLTRADLTLLEEPDPGTGPAHQ